MIPLLLTAIIATPTDRLATFIAARNPKASSYAPLLAKRIVIESKRHGLKAWDLAAVAAVESHFDRRARGKRKEHGIWQVMVREHGIENAWNWLRSNPAGFPLAAKWGAIPWSRLGRHRVTILQSIREGAYIAAWAIASHVALCKRMGHRIGRYRCKSVFINLCPKGRYHRFEIDRIGHFNSGISTPGRGYLRKLRRWSKQIKRIMKGTK